MWPYELPGTQPSLQHSLQVSGGKVTQAGHAGMERQRRKQTRMDEQVDVCQEGIFVSASGDPACLFLFLAMVSSHFLNLITSLWESQTWQRRKLEEQHWVSHSASENHVRVTPGLGPR